MRLSSGLHTTRNSLIVSLRHVGFGRGFSQILHLGAGYAIGARRLMAKSDVPISVSAVPMAARVVNRVGLESNPQNYLLMHAMGPNVAGVIGSAVAAGLMIMLVGG